LNKYFKSHVKDRVTSFLNKQFLTMKKFLLVVAVVLVTAVAGNAQDKKWNIGVGGGLAIPTGDASDWVKTGLDGFVLGTYSFTPKFSAGVELNYTNLPGKTVSTILGDLDAPDAEVTAFLAKGIYTFTEQGFRPYVSGAVGFYSHKDGDTKVGAAAEAGFKYNQFGLGAAYHMAGKEDDVTFSYIQLNFTYTFSF
jgi:hypothetical protein